MLVWNHNSLCTFKKRIGPVSHLLAKHANEALISAKSQPTCQKIQGRTTYHAMPYCTSEWKAKSLKCELCSSRAIKSIKVESSHSEKRNISLPEQTYARQNEKSTGKWDSGCFYPTSFLLKPCWFRDSDHNQIGSEIMNHTNESFSIFTPLTYTMLDESNTAANRHAINNHSNQSFTSSFGWCLTP